MRRALLLASVILSLAACSTQERPEGIVERWLLALNQGSAGEPERYASATISAEALPRWNEREPGQLDVIEVGRATVGCGVSGWFVPFRIVRLDGSTLRSTACVDASDVVELFPRALGEAAIEVHALPSEGGPPTGEASSPMWASAIAVGLGIVLVAESLMSLVRHVRSD